MSGPQKNRKRPSGRTTQRRDAFAALKRETLGRKLAEDDVESGDDDEGDCNGDRVSADGGEGSQ